MIDLLHRKLPCDVELEQLTLSALAVGHWYVQWAYEEQLDVDDFHLGEADLHGWLFNQMRWALRKRVEPMAEIVRFSHKAPVSYVQTLYESVKEILKTHGEVRMLDSYISVLKELRQWREKIIAAEHEYQAAWKAFDDQCM